MMKRTFPGASAYVKDGNRYWRYRKDGRQVALAGVWGSAEFIASYEAAVAALAAPQVTKIYPPRSLGALALAYFGSISFTRLKDNTRAEYRGQIQPLLDAHGHRRVTADHFNAAICQKVLQVYADRPGAGTNVRRRLITMFDLAIRLGWRTDNPARHTDAFRLSSGGITAWTEADIARFLDHYPVGSWQRRACMLMLATGVARADLVRLQASNVEAGILSYRRQKMEGRDGVQISVPLPPELLEDLPASGWLITNAKGQPLTAGAFGNVFRDACRAAGVLASPHGLRKACARRLAEAGCSALMIASITGHKSLAEVARYTASADRAALAKSAFKKLHDGEGKSLSPSTTL